MSESHVTSELAKSGGNGTLMTAAEDRSDHSFQSIDEDEYELISSVSESITRSGQSESLGITLSDASATSSPHVSTLGFVLSQPPTAPPQDYTASVGTLTNFCLPQSHRSNPEDGEDGDRTPIMHRSVQIGSVEALLSNSRDTPLLDHSTTANEGGLEMRYSLTDCSDESDFVDPLEAIESIRANYKAAYETTCEENRALLEKCKENNEKMDDMRRRLQKANDENLHMDLELKKNEVALKNLRFKFDELTAEKMQCDDVIKMQEVTIHNLRSDGNGSAQPPSVVHEQAMLRSLQAKDAQIAELRAALDELQKRYEKERSKGLDLEEIVKVLNEQSNESEQMLRQAQEEYQFRLRRLEQQTSTYVDRGEVNNV